MQEEIMDGNTEMLSTPELTADASAEVNDTPESNDDVETLEGEQPEGEEPQVTDEPEQEDKRSKFVPRERFDEVYEKARRAELLEQEKELYRQQIEHYRQLQPQAPKTPEELQREAELAEARRVLKDELGLMTREDYEAQQREAQLEAARQAGVQSVLRQAETINQKYASKGLPKADPQDLVRWAEESLGAVIDPAKVSDNLVETLYKARYSDKLSSHYAQAKPATPPVAKSTAQQPAKTVTPDDVFKMKPEELDAWWASQKGR